MPPIPRRSSRGQGGGLGGRGRELCPLAKVYYVNSERAVFELLAQPPLEALQGMHIDWGVASRNEFGALFIDVRIDSSVAMGIA